MMKECIQNFPGFSLSVKRKSSDELSPVKNKRKMIVKDDSPIQSSEIVPEGQPNLEDQLEDGEVSTAYENDPGDDFYIHFNKTGVHLSHVENKIDSICSHHI